VASEIFTNIQTDEEIQKRIPPSQIFYALNIQRYTLNRYNIKTYTPKDLKSAEILLAIFQTFNAQNILNDTFVKVTILDS